MSVTTDWMDAKYSVIHINFVDHWDWSELYNGLEAAHTLMDRSHQAITLMLDFIGSYKVSATSTLYTAADSIDQPAMIDRVVIVSDDPQLAKKMASLIADIYPNASKIVLASNHQEAFERVRHTMEMKAVN